jgi:hypothetical protein
MLFLRLLAFAAAIMIVSLVAIGFLTKNRNYFQYAWRAFWVAICVAAVFLVFLLAEHLVGAG